jgi:hypothetical protein
MYTEVQGVRKTFRIYVDVDIEFNLEVLNDQLTCGWLLSEVERRYLDAVNRIKEEMDREHMNRNMGG